MAVLGPTAAGKSDLAEAIAAQSGSSIVSVDSMQVFRGMDIGTAKPNLATRNRFGYYLVDIADPAHEFTVADFQAAGSAVLSDIEAAGRHSVVAGGSGLHFRSLVDPLEFPPTDPGLRRDLETQEHGRLVEALLLADPTAATVVDLANPRRVLRAVEVLRLTGSTPTERAATPDAEAVRTYRPARPFTAIGVDPGPLIAERIENRFDQMLAAGFLSEVAEIAPLLGRTARQAVGYRELLGVIEGVADLETARADAIRATVALAKRQRTYFRRDPRIHWIPWHHEPEAVVQTAIDVLAKDAPWIS